MIFTFNFKMYCELVQKKHGTMIKKFCGVIVIVLILSAIDLWFYLEWHRSLVLS